MSRNGIDQAAGIDVAIPCYNYGRFLRNCVAGVLSQEIPKPPRPDHRQRLDRQRGDSATACR